MSEIYFIELKSVFILGLLETDRLCSFLWIKLHLPLTLILSPYLNHLFSHAYHNDVSHLHGDHRGRLAGKQTTFVTPISQCLGYTSICLSGCLWLANEEGEDLWSWTLFIGLHLFPLVSQTCPTLMSDPRSVSNCH